MMLNKCLYTEQAPEHWGVENCPICRGVGLINRKDMVLGLYRLHESVCPNCKDYQHPSDCPAWFPEKIESYVNWVFIPENACGEILRIYSALNSLGLISQAG